MNLPRRPDWLQKKINLAAHAEMDRLLDDHRLHTVCREAICPNISECFRNRQATFLILGRVCTRLCTFCNVTKETPLPVDPEEPGRVAHAVVRLGLAHVVVTSPTRDDLADGGASLYAATVAAIRAASPDTRIELLIPDFKGDRASIALVTAAGPDIIGHNVETVPRLYHIRSGADYGRSLAVLAAVREFAPGLKTKSGIMVGLGETEVEVLAVCADLRHAGCDFLSIGQYLAPSKKHFPVQEFIRPERFDFYREKALALGFEHVESGPYVRSSYHAGDYPSLAPPQ
ncbi:MAG TPA: lipoyl synthase [Geobacteraceae bacterium]